MSKLRIVIAIAIMVPLLLRSQINRPVGINLSSVNDYSTEFVFVDAFKQSRNWISFNADNSGSWSTGIFVPLNENGYPVSIPYIDGINPPQAIRALMLWDLDSAMPMGKYRLISKGKGQIRLRFGAAGIFNSPVDTLVNVTGQVSLELLSSDVIDPISDIKFIYPQYKDTYANKLFTDEFITFISGFQVIRFMDFTRTNNSNVEKWGDRTLKTNFTQAASNGVAWEHVIDLCNLTHKNAWINIPHKADDNYILELATMLKSKIDPELKIYIEYSNEVWNSIFDQNNYAANEAEKLGYSGQPWERTWKYTAKRSADVFHIFDGIFNDDNRLIKVIPSQAANSWLSNQIITFFEDPFYNLNGVKADALGIAPYFGGNVANGIVANGLVSTISVAEIVELMRQSIPTSSAWIKDSKIVANNHGLDLICYEGGQHLVGNGGNENNTELTAKLNAANHHPDLEEAYCEYMDNWYAESEDLMCHFSSHSKYTKWGSWGVKETMLDTLNPKYLALQNCVFSWNSITNTSAPETIETNISVYPNPSNNNQFNLISERKFESMQLFNILGQQVDFEVIHQEDGFNTIEITQKGHFFLRTNVGTVKLISN